jgi:hypothetical protein
LLSKAINTNILALTFFKNLNPSLLKDFAQNLIPGCFSDSTNANHPNDIGKSLTSGDLIVKNHSLVVEP